MTNLRRTLGMGILVAMVATRAPYLPAQGTITLAAGQTPVARVLPTARIAVPIVVDMTAATGGTNLAALFTSAAWGPSRLTLDSIKAGAFGTLTANTSNASTGSATLSLTSGTGTTASVTIATMYFSAAATAGGTRLLLAPASAADQAAASVLALLRSRALDVCVGPYGLWGDVNDDGIVNIIDAQQIARSSVGLVVANPPAVMARGDVNADGNVNIIDAQQIARFSVGLSAAPRVNTSQYVAPTVGSVTIAQASPAVTIGGVLQLTAIPRDAGNVDLSGCAPVTWTTSDASKVAVDATTGVVTGVAAGSATITATAGTQSGQVLVTVSSGGGVTGGSVAISGGNNQFAPAGTAVPTAPSVVVLTSSNAPVVGATVTFAIASGGGTVTGAIATTNASGVATVGSWVLGPAQGLNTLAATVTGTGVTGNPVTLTATGIAGAPATMSIVSGDNQVQLVNNVYVAPLTVLVRDASNNPVAGVNVTFAVATGGGSFATNPTQVAATGATGRASATWTAGNAGAQTATATVGSLPVITFNARNVPNNNGHARCELSSTGAAYCWGDNAHGQVGDGTSGANRLQPTLVLGGLTFATLADGSADHACGLTPGGQAYCWGANAFGQLGDGTTVDRSTPTVVPGGFTFTQLAVSLNATCGRTTAGALVCWGWAGYGLFGDGVQGISRLVPTTVTAAVPFTSVSLAQQHACAVAASGVVYCWGNNANSQLGDGTNTVRTAPTPLTDGRTYAVVLASFAHSCALTTAGAAFCWGNGSAVGTGSTATAANPIAVAGGLTFTSMSTGLSQTTCALTAAGAAYCWGINGSNQLGDGTNTTRLAPTAVAGGIAFASLRMRGLSGCGRVAGGQPYCWGFNSFGQLGDGTQTQRSSPVAVRWVEGTPGVAVSLAANAGDNQSGAPGATVAIAPSVIVRDYTGNPVAGVSVTFSVASGGGSLVGGATTSNASGIATVGSWTLGASAGVNTMTATGTGLPTATFSATGTAGAPASMTLVSGDNQVQSLNGAFVAPLTVLVKDNNNSPVSGVVVTFAQASGAGTFQGGATLNVTTNASGLAAATWTAASTAATQTATATVTGVAPVTFTGRSAPTSNGYARCELTTANVAYCWGDNTHGQVGDGSFTNRPLPTLVGGGLTFASLADGSADHVCGLTAAGKAYCWGANQYGQLGDGTIIDRTAPTAVNTSLAFTQLAVSLSATCGRTAAGAMVCWGSAGYGLYGDGVQGVVQLVPTQVAAGTLTFTNIAIGSVHACAVATGGTVHCWGLNSSSQLGDGTNITRTAPTPILDGRSYSSVVVSASHTCALTTGGAAFCWGTGGSGNLGNGATVLSSVPVAVAGGLTFVSISAGGTSNHTCALTITGAAHCWGLNSNSQLGDGTNVNRLVPTPVFGGITFAAIRLRSFSSCGRATNGQPYCWGFNSFGQLGDGSNSGRPFPVPVSWVEGVAGVAVSMVATTGNGQSAAAGSAVTVAPTVIVRDFAGASVAGVSVTFGVASGGGSVTGATVTTNANGLAIVGSWILGPSVGATNTLTATASGLPVVTFTATGTAAAASVSLVSGDNQVQSTNATFVVPPTVLVKDAAGNGVQGVTVVFSLTSGTGSFSGGTPFTTTTNAAGIASASWFAGGTVGTQTIAATVAGLTPVTFSARNAPSVNGYTRCERTLAGKAYCWGDNTHGQVGDGTTTTRTLPTAVNTGLSFIALAEGNADHACGLTGGGQAYCWGANAYGQLGDGTIVDRTAPVAVTGSLVFTQLAVSLNATCGITNAGAIACWGAAGYGLYGDGVQGVVRLAPTAVAAGGVTFSNIAIGQNHACAIATAGTMYCWGLNSSFQLGVGNSTTRTAPTAITDGRSYFMATVGSAHSCGLTTAGAAFCWGAGNSGQLGNGSTNSLSTPAAVSGALTFTSIGAANSSNTCATTSAFQTYCWGSNTQGQLGDGTTTQRLLPTPVGAGIPLASVRLRSLSSCGRALSGQPYCWGYNAFGQLGDGTTTQRLTPTAVLWVEGIAGVPVSMAVNSGNGQSGTAGATLAVPPSVIVRDFAGAPVSGTTVTFAVTAGGGSVTGATAVTNAAGIATVGSWTLGSGFGANILTATANGLPTVTFSATSTVAPASLSIVDGDNQVQAVFNQLPAPLSVVVRDAANNPIANVSVTFAVSAGGGNLGGLSTSVVATNASGLASVVWSVGSSVGAQAVTATVASLAPITFTGRSVASGTGYTRCELTSVGAAYCWGDNSRGQIGDGSTTNRLVPTPVGGGVAFASLAEGNADHVCGLTSAGQAYCWGSNAYGQLGDGSIVDRTGPVAVQGGHVFTQLAVSLHATCGRTSAGALLCWGWAGFGLYGDGILGVARLSPTPVTAGGITFSRVAIAPQHYCAVSTGGSLYCWGTGTSGQLGNGTFTSVTVPTLVPDGRTYAAVATANFYSCALTTTGAAFCWGSGNQGQLGNGSTASPGTPTAVVGGLTFGSISVGTGQSTCALTTSGAPYCWGLNNQGQLGDGSTSQRLVPTQVTGGLTLSALRVRGLSACGRATGSAHPFCWGYNVFGQLGDGTTTQRLSPVPVLWVEGTAGVGVSMVVSAGNGQSATAGTAVAVSPSVLVRDFAGNPVSGTSVTFAVTSGGGSVTGATAITNASGVATVGNWTLGASFGTHTLTATANGLPTIIFTATSTIAPASLSIVDGDNQVQTTNNQFPAPATVVVRDAGNNPISGVSVTFAITAGGGNLAGSTATVVATNASGVASVVWNVGSTLGAQTATATVAGLAPITFAGRSVAFGVGYTRCELTSTGAAYCWGDNAHGQLGDGSTISRPSPTAVGGGLAFASLAEGTAEHMCGLTSAGQAYCWGANAYGQLGDGSIVDRGGPVAVLGGQTFTQLAVSVNATCGRTPAGALFCWGWAGYGLYGDGIQGVARLTPTPVNAGGVTFSRIAIGVQHYCAVATSGSMYCWGFASSGQTGSGVFNRLTVPTIVPDGRAYALVAVGSNHSCGLTTSGTAFCWGSGSQGQLGNGSQNTFSSPTAVAGGLSFSALSIGSGQSACALTTAGKPYCWGNNGNGELGDGTTTQRLVPTAVAGNLTLSALRARALSACGRTVGNSQPFCWGYNGSGQLGDGTFTQRLSPVSVLWVEGIAGVAVSMAVNAGNGQSSTAGLPVSVAPSVIVRDYRGIAVNGTNVSFAVTSGGGSVTAPATVTNASGVATVGSWTLGSSLGVNTLTATAAGLPDVTFTATGTATPASIAILTGDNQVQSPGSGFLAPISVVVRDATNQPIPNASVTFAVTVGGGQLGGPSTAVVSTNALGVASVSWAPGNVGPQSLTATVSGLAPLTFTGRSVSSSLGFARCELTTTGSAYCWGDNQFGQVGDGTTIRRLLPTAVAGGPTFTALAEGNADHACGLTSGGQAFCWGSNAYGQLGDGTIIDRSGPVAVTGGQTFTQLSVSVTATCGRTAGGTLLCWGFAGYGLYGDGVQGTARLTPTNVTSGNTFTSVSIGATHYCAVATAGAAYCWGLATSGQLGDGAFVTRTVPTLVPDGRTYTVISVGRYHTCGLTTAGAAFCWGDGGNGEIGNGSNSTVGSPTAVAGGLTFASLSAGLFDNTCARTASGTAYCWGANSTGGLGNGTTSSRNAPTAVAGGLSFASLRAGYASTCGRTGSGQPYCWGYNSYGQLGDGTTIQRLTPTAVNWVEGTPGVAVSMAISTGNAQSAGVGNAVAVAPSVIVKDYAGNPVNGVTVTFAIASGGGSVAGASAVTNASGIAVVGSWTLGPSPGANTLTAQAVGTQRVTFTATGQ